MDEIYRDMSLEQIPWNRSEPPQILVDAVESGNIKPCKTVDLGCGAGNYSIWLAKHGFNVTGIDISERAVQHARQAAEGADVKCNFHVRDIIGDLSEFKGSFDFALDWELLHHIFPEDRPKYVKNVHDMLKPDGRYFSLGFSEGDPSFGGEGKFRETPIGTVLYFSSEDELEELFHPFFKIIAINTVEIAGKHGPHEAISSWLKRK
ncbi:MAG: methyltransferase domain-containing protein [candidate division Zixibacteria bacterium]|nr:methyltransferase domain-containing protein [candidate division Zixibacteria bacterium]